MQVLENKGTFASCVFWNHGEVPLRLVCVPWSLRYCLPFSRRSETALSFDFQIIFGIFHAPAWLLGVLLAKWHRKEQNFLRASILHPEDPLHLIVKAIGSLFRDTNMIQFAQLQKNVVQLVASSSNSGLFCTAPTKSGVFSTASVVKPTFTRESVCIYTGRFSSIAFPPIGSTTLNYRNHLSRSFADGLVRV